MGNIFACMKAQDQLPQIKIVVKSNCCNTHTLVFHTDKHRVHDFLNDSIKRYAINSRDDSLEKDPNES